MLCMMNLDATAARRSDIAVSVYKVQVLHFYLEEAWLLVGTNA